MLDLRYPIGVLVVPESVTSDDRAGFLAALTEDNPTMQPYDEAGWAALSDSNRPIGGSLGLLDHLHERWVALLSSLSTESFGRTYFHPQSKRRVTLDGAVATYAWHGAHHVAHVTELRRREGW